MEQTLKKINNVFGSGLYMYKHPKTLEPFMAPVGFLFSSRHAMVCDIDLINKILDNFDLLKNVQVFEDKKHADAFCKTKQTAYNYLFDNDLI